MQRKIWVLELHARPRSRWTCTYLYKITSTVRIVTSTSIYFFMRGKAMLADTSHRDTLAGCDLMNSDRAAQFALMVTVFFLLLFC